MSFLSGIGDLLSSAVNLAVTYFTGSQMLGQMAGNLVSSLINESGSSGNSGFDNTFNNAWSQGLLNAVRG